MDGYYRIPRGWMDAPWLNSQRNTFDRRSAWIWLIENARWRDEDTPSKGRSEPLLRGQLCHRVAFMATAWNWDEKTVRIFLNSAVSAQQLVLNSTRDGMLITIRDYEAFSASLETRPGTHPELIPNSSDNKKEGERKRIKESLPEAEDSSSSRGQENPFQTDLLRDNVVGLVVPPDLPHRAMELWNDMAKATGLSVVRLDKALEIYKTRRRRLVRLLDDLERHTTPETAGLAVLERFKLCLLDRIAATPFCLGAGERGWRIDLDNLCEMGKIYGRLIEGKYDVRISAAPQKSKHQQSLDSRAGLDALFGFTSECDIGDPGDTFDGVTIDHLEARTK